MEKENGINREKIIKEYAEKLLQKIDSILPSKPTEADFRRVIDPLLDQFSAEVELTPIVHAEYTLATGKADAVFNRLIVEYERPGTLNSTWDKPTLHAVQQVVDYIEGVVEKEHHERERLAGVALDGYYICFVRHINGKLSKEPPVEVNRHSVERLLTWLSGLSSGVALTAENLNKDFSIEQPRTQQILSTLYSALGSILTDENSMVAKLFAQWRLFFSESIEYSETFGGRKLEPLKKWVRKAGIEIEKPEEAEIFLFALHTYFALLVKFLAWLALSKHLAVKLGAPSFSTLYTLEREALHENLKKMEEGGIFHAYGIMNLLEGDFFEWYLYAWDNNIETAIKGLLKRLDQYDPTTLSELPEETRDLFKKLYHYLLPREVRHNLGEYYTPDWLAERLLNQVNQELFDQRKNPLHEPGRLREKLMKTRWLDPACGSGTFLVLIIHRMLELGRVLMVREGELLESIMQNVQGIDLNPLAVLTARVNYLLAILRLLEYRKKELVIPIWLADSVRTPAAGEDMFSADAYEFPTAIGKFQVPAILCKAGDFDRFCGLLEESVKAEVAVESFVKRLLTELSLKPPQWTEQASNKLQTLYQKMLDLHLQGMNGLWARLLKNNFAPLTIGQFDYVVGNPPWVNWESLPDDYRQSIKPIWEHYGLFPHSGMDTILGKGKKDISMLMTYVVMDKLLVKGGKLGFVITQSVFKTSGSGQGFRHFSIPLSGKKQIPLKVVYVDDMVSLNPFEGASNRTSVIVLEKGRPTKYPVSYTLWRKKKGEHFTYDSSLDQAIMATERYNLSAEPVNETDPTSAWLTARPKALKAIRKVLGRSEYTAHEGVNSGGANSVYWLKIMDKRPDGFVVVKNITKGAKIKVEEITTAIEPDLVYPLLRGRDVKRWKVEPSASILMAQDPIKRRGIEEREMQEKYPKTYSYLKIFEDMLRNRPAIKRYFTRKDKSGKVIETGPFYSMFDVGDYTFAPWKVVWRYIATEMTSAVISEDKEKIIIPDCKLMIVNCEGYKGAYYVSGVLNSVISRFTVSSFIIGTQISTHVLEKIRIPKFNSDDSVHKRLAELSQQAHKAAAEDDQKTLKNIEAEINQQAAQLWGLNDKELAEIQRSLAELGGKEEAQEEDEQ